MINQLILQRVNQASQETVLPLGIGVDIFRSVARQLQKPVSILADRRWEPRDDKANDSGSSQKKKDGKKKRRIKKIVYYDNNSNFSYSA